MRYTYPNPDVVSNLFWEYEVHCFMKKFVIQKMKSCHIWDFAAYYSILSPFPTPVENGAVKECIHNLNQHRTLNLI